MVKVPYGSHIWKACGFILRDVLGMVGTMGGDLRVCVVSCKPCEAESRNGKYLAT